MQSFRKLGPVIYLPNDTVFEMNLSTSDAAKKTIVTLQ